MRVVQALLLLLLGTQILADSSFSVADYTSACGQTTLSSQESSLLEQISQASGGTTVLIPAGIYTSKILPLSLGSHIRVVGEQAASVVFVGCAHSSSSPADYAFTATGVNTTLQSMSFFDFAIAPLLVKANAELFVKSINFNWTLPSGLSDVQFLSSTMAPSAFDLTTTRVGGAVIQAGARVTVFNATATNIFGVPSGLFTVDTAARLSISSSTFFNISGARAGLATFNGGAELELNNSVLTQLTSFLAPHLISDWELTMSAGVAIFGKGSSFSATNNTISNCMGFNGGVFAVEGGLNVIRNTTFTGNHARSSPCSTQQPCHGNGGVIAASGRANVTMINCNASKQVADQRGGVIASSGGASVTVVGGSWEGNAAFSSAGDIFAEDLSSVQVSGCHFSRSFAKFGGVLSVQDSASVIVSHCTFVNCTAHFGGIISLAGNAVALVAASHVKSATATRGGAIHASASSSISIDGVRFYNCSAQQRGGVVFCSDECVAAAQRSDFDTNYAESGGVFAAQGTARVVMINSTAQNNAAVLRGGVAIGEDLANVTFSHSSVTYNIVTRGGGGVIFVTDRSTFTADTCILDSNVATYGGVVCAQFSTNYNFVNCPSVSNNQAMDGDIAPAGDGGAIHVMEQILDTLSMWHSLTPAVVRRYHTFMQYTSSILTWAQQNTPFAAALSRSPVGLSIARVFTELPQGSHVNTLFSFNKAVRGGVLNVHDTQMSMSGLNCSSNYASTDGGAYHYTWNHFNYTMTVDEHEQGYAHVYAINTISFNNSAGVHGGMCALNLNSFFLPNQDFWFVSVNEQASYSSAQIGGYAYFSNVLKTTSGIPVQENVLNVALNALRATTDKGHNTASLYGDWYASSKFQLALSFYHPVPAIISLFSGELLDIAGILEMQDLIQTRVADNADQITVSLGYCNATAGMPPAAVGFAAGTSLSFSLANGFAEVVNYRVFGMPGTYCLTFSQTAQEGVRAVSQMFMIQSDSNRLAVSTYESEYPRDAELLTVPSSVTTAFLVFGSIFIAAASAAMFMVYHYRKTKLVQIYGGNYLMIILCGLILAEIPSLLGDLSLDRATCAVTVWMPFLGAALVMSMFTLKMFKLHNDTNHKNLKLKLKSLDVLRAAAAAFVAMLVCLVFWTVGDNMDPQQIINYDANTVFYQCKYQAIAVYVPLSILGLALALCLYWGWMTRSITTWHNEARYIRYILASMLVVLAVCVTLYSITISQFVYGFSVTVLLTCAISVLLFLIMFIPITAALLTTRWYPKVGGPFVCYAYPDAFVAHDLAKYLEERGMEVYLDDTRRDANSSHRSEVANALKLSKCVIFLQSTHSVENRYCLSELHMAYDHNIPIFPVIVDAKDIGVPETKKMDPGLEMLLIAFQWTPYFNTKQCGQDLYEGIQEVEFDSTHHSLGTPVVPVDSINSTHSDESETDVEEAIARTNPLPLAGNKAVFISWSHTAKAIVDMLTPQLYSRGVYYWLDVQDLISGSKWRAHIAEAINRCPTFLFVLTKSAVKSKYCMEEFNYARQCNKRVIILVYENVETELSVLKNSHVILNAFASCIAFDMTTSTVQNILPLVQAITNPAYEPPSSNYFTGMVSRARSQSTEVQNAVAAAQQLALPAPVARRTNSNELLDAMISMQSIESVGSTAALLEHDASAESAV